MARKKNVGINCILAFFFRKPQQVEKSQIIFFLKRIKPLIKKKEAYEMRQKDD